MGLFFIYSLKVALCLTAFYLVYKLLLSRETFYGFNRAVVLCIIGTSLLLPLVHVSTEAPAAGLGGFVVVEGVIAEAVAAEPSGFSVTAAQVCFAIYIIGVAFFALRWAWSLFSLVRLVRGGRVVSRDGGVRVIVVGGDVPPFSWMNNIVVSAADYADSPECILAHERAHVAGRHSVDIMVCDALIVVQWFNPAAWLLKAELQALHEYEADRAVLASGVDARSYQMLLIRKAVGEKLFSMANNLNQCSLKNRITMMLKRKSNPWRRGRSLLAVPVAAFAVAAFATPKAESLSVEIENEGNALVSSVSPAVKAQVVRTPQAEAKDSDDISTDEFVDMITEGFVSKTDADGLVAYDDSTRGVAFKGMQIIVDENAKGGAPSEGCDESAEFHGGNSALSNWLCAQMRYPEAAAKAGKQGSVYMMFVIDKDGNVTQPKVVKGVDPDLDAEALRMVKAMPKWKPAKLGGKPVAVRYALPIRFRIDGEGMDAVDASTLPKQGGRTFNGTALYVVDGKPVGNVCTLKPAEVVSVKSYKDKEHTTDKYGDAAKNGVIMITTKNAGK